MCRTNENGVAKSSYQKIFQNLSIVCWFRMFYLSVNTLQYFPLQRRKGTDVMNCIRKDICILIWNLTIGNRAGICHTPKQNRLKTRESHWKRSDLMQN